MSAWNCRRAVVALAIVLGWIVSLVWPDAAYVVGCAVGAFWFGTLHAANREAGGTSNGQ